MDISNSKFLKLTANQLNLANAQYNSNVEYIENSTAANKAHYHSCINLVAKSADTDISIENIGSALSDEALENIYKTAQVPSFAQKASEMNFSTSYKDFTPAEISRIKQLIYNIHNDIDETPDTSEDTDTPSSEKNSFISEFTDTTTLFEYMNKFDSSITKESGVTKAQLVAFTQRDDWEDSNYDFFGSLNRVFSKIDTNDNAILSFAEIKKFIGDEIGEDFSDYYDKVNDYANEIQTEYSKLNNQKKLEFALDKTREYLNAAGLEKQIEALDRLVEQEDLYNSIHVGQISIADLNKNNKSDFITLGAYNYYAYGIDYTNNVDTYNVAIWAHDNDNNENGDDLGITLDISLLNGKWYELVNTLVHELTHATAHQYYANDGSGDPTYYTLQLLYEIGAITAEEKEYYENNELTTEDFRRIYYLASCAWGEYSAYQTDADYNDSIGADVYNSSTDNNTTAVDGPDEKQAIIDHIEESYNYTDEDGTHKEPMPDYKWWSYA